MSLYDTLTENIRFETLADIPSQSVNGATVNGVAWLDMSKYEKVLIVCHCGAMAGGGIATFSVFEALSAAGGTPLAIAGKTAVFTQASGEANMTKVIEIDTGEMRVNTRYRWIRPRVVESGGFACVCVAVVLRMEGRYVQAVPPA